MIVSRSAATSLGDFAERRIASGCFARRAARSASHAIDLVEEQARRDNLRTNLAQHVAGHLDLRFVSRVGCVDDEQQQRRFERLGKRGSERRDEIVRQLLDEPDRVRDEHARLRLRLQRAHRRVKDPHEMTALGVISENVREIYAREVEACYDEAGKVARGPQFLNCLQRQARSQQDILEAVYSARMSYLRSNAPELAQSLQSAQEAWLHFREANCGFGLCRGRCLPTAPALPLKTGLRHIRLAALGQSQCPPLRILRSPDYCKGKKSRPEQIR